MEGFSCNDGGMVINLSLLNKIEWMDANTIKVGPGCTLSNIYDAILPKGKFYPADPVPVWVLADLHLVVVMVCWEENMGLPATVCRR